MISDIKVTNNPDDLENQRFILILDSLSEESFVSSIPSIYEILIAFWDVVDLSMSPKDCRECKLTPFTWDDHGKCVADYIRRLEEEDSKITLYIYSKDVTVRAMALALAISESSVFKGKFTEELLKQCQPELDNLVLIEYKGMKSALYNKAKELYKNKAKELTRYELLGELTNSEIYNFVFEEYSKDLDFSNLI